MLFHFSFLILHNEKTSFGERGFNQIIIEVSTFNSLHLSFTALTSKMSFYPKGWCSRVSTVLEFSSNFALSHVQKTLSYAVLYSLMHLTLHATQAAFL